MIVHGGLKEQLLNKRGNEFIEADVALLLILSQVAVAVLTTADARLAAGSVAKT